MFIVTGGAGFIGSNIVKALNDRDQKVIAVDSLDGKSDKFKNLISLNIEDFIDSDNFLHFLDKAKDLKIDGIIHQGAVSSTQETDGKLIMQTNYELSMNLLTYCIEFGIPLIYASTAGVYGMNSINKESAEYEKPITLYGYSKLLVDRQVRKLLPKASSQIVGLRYFNVYGPGESHKKGQCSPFYRYYNELKTQGYLEVLVGKTGTETKAELFTRDFVYIDDIVNVVTHFIDNLDISGIFNVGSGQSRSFDSVKKLVVDSYLQEQESYCGYGLNFEYDKSVYDSLVQKKSFPKSMYGKSQPYSCADLTKLREEGKYEKDFLSIKAGWEKYHEWLKKEE